MGKTAQSEITPIPKRKHPHSRGEDSRSARSFLAASETPPLAWGRRRRLQQAILLTGNTPTRVGKTQSATNRTPTTKKHPHSRGEDTTRLPATTRTMETPPLAWGRHPQDRQLNTERGNTPTRVGKTDYLIERGIPFEKHPHSRGEDIFRLVTCKSIWETPPLAWGRPREPGLAGIKARNTPTRVGKDVTDASS